jgi:type IV fimbrial biogenesis protein FimT
MKRSARGFTLMELMMVIALAAILFGVAIPAFRDFARNGRLTGAANELLVTVVAARNAAMREQVNAAVCTSANPDADAPVCADDATAGWFAFTDNNGDCVFNGADEVVSYVEFHSEIDPVSNSSCILFARTGFRTPVAGQPGTARAMFCDERGNTLLGGTDDLTPARGLEVLPTGRAYTSRSFAELDGWAGGADPVSCP